MLLKELSSLASPLSKSQVDQLKLLAGELNPVQLAWVSGYLAASASATGIQPPETTDQPVITILYGSQTGNGRSVAEALFAKAQAQGMAANLVSMHDYKVRQLKQETLMLLVVSTHGEGEAPDDALELHQFLASKRAPKLEQLHFSVLALGDSSYEFFCQTGKDFSARLQALGAKPLQEIVECDVDYETAAEQWQQDVIKAVEPHIQASATIVPIVNAVPNTVATYNKQNPLKAELIVSQKLTGRDSDRDVRHVEIDLDGSNLTYQAGDALGVWFTNAMALVEELMRLLSLDGEAEVLVGKEKMSLQHALIEKKELTQIFPGLVTAWAERSADATLLAIAADKEQTRQFVLNNQLADLANNYPLLQSIQAQAFIDLLRPITPRLYSIASAQAEVESEVHLTVALVAQPGENTVRFGGASQFLTAAQEGQAVRVYVEPNKHFRLPDDPDTPVIMIGPGTGVAPFRAFMQQRAADGAKGKSWLFFGNPHFEQDFLYQTEWQQYLNSGVLSRIDVAFSRDQQDKVYVQHKIKQQGAELLQWLESGAHLYICGDAQRMAKDVHQALVEVVCEFGGQDVEQAEAFLDELRREHRYQKDVY